MSEAEWARVEAECSYEAAKATASASPKTAISEVKEHLFTMCVELKGARRIGKISLPDAQWRPIFARCKNQARTAVASRPASPDRDRQEDNLAIACLKQEGISFR